MGLYDWINDNRRMVIRGGGAIVLLAASVLLMVYALDEGESKAPQQRKLYADVRRVKSGHKIELDDQTLLIYAGIRAPFPGEPFHEQAKARNTELVDRRRIRLRFDEVKEDRKNRKLAYVFVNGAFVNEMLVREGLAYVRITSFTQRFADRLLVAQEDARKNRRGLWKQPPPAGERSYTADPKYGNFHRPSCAEVGKIPADRRENFSSRGQALMNGYAPCAKCKP